MAKAKIKSVTKIFIVKSLFFDTEASEKKSLLIIIDELVINLIAFTTLCANVGLMHKLIRTFSVQQTGINTVLCKKYEN